LPALRHDLVDRFHFIIIEFAVGIFVETRERAFRGRFELLFQRVDFVAVDLVIGVFVEIAERFCGTLASRGAAPSGFVSVRGGGFVCARSSSLLGGGSSGLVAIGSAKGRDRGESERADE
jgi:hypothetical protein